MKHGALVHRPSPWRLAGWETTLLLLAAFFAYCAALSATTPTAGPHPYEDFGQLLGAATVPTAIVLVSFLIRAMRRASGSGPSARRETEGERAVNGLRKPTRAAVENGGERSQRPRSRALRARSHTPDALAVLFGILLIALLPLSIALPILAVILVGAFVDWRSRRARAAHLERARGGSRNEG